MLLQQLAEMCVCVVKGGGNDFAEAIWGCGQTSTTGSASKLRAASSFAFVLKLWGLLKPYNDPIGQAVLCFHTVGITENEHKQPLRLTQGTILAKKQETCSKFYILQSLKIITVE